jgi:hypothetical protein
VQTYPAADATRIARRLVERSRASSNPNFDKALVLAPVCSSSNQSASTLTRKPTAHTT